MFVLSKLSRRLDFQIWIGWVDFYAFFKRFLGQISIIYEIHPKGWKLGCSELALNSILLVKLKSSRPPSRFEAGNNREFFSWQFHRESHTVKYNRTFMYILDIGFIEIASLIS